MNFFAEAEQAGFCPSHVGPRMNTSRFLALLVLMQFVHDSIAFFVDVAISYPSNLENRFRADAVSGSPNAV